MPEVAFILEKSPSEKFSFLVRLVEIENEQGRIKFLPSSRFLYKETLKKMATTKDRQAITVLIQEEIHYQGLQGLRVSSDTLPFNTVHVSINQSEKILKELAATGKVYFAGKKILIDFFIPVEFFCEILPAANDGIEVIPKCLFGDKEIEMTQGEFIFQGVQQGFLKDGVLRFLCDKHKEPLEGKWIKIFKNGSIKCESSQKKAVLEKFQGQEIRCLIADEVVTEDKPEEILPILILKDRTGGFANLWMNYGEEKKIDFHDSHSTFSRKKDVEKQWEADLLETDFIKKQVGTTAYYCPLNKVAKSLTFLLECGWTILDAQERRLQRFTDVEASLEATSTGIIAKGKVCYENHQVDVANVVGAFNRRETFIAIGGNAIGLLPENFKEGPWNVLLDGEIVGEGVKLKKNHFGNLKELLENRAVRADQTLQSLKNALSNFQGIEEVLPSIDFKGILRPYQQQGLNWLSFLYHNGFHGLLADDMGLGKTVQILAFLSTLAIKEPHLIVLPTTLLFNWQKEIERFLPHMICYKHHGPERFTDVKLFDNTQIILTSYGTLRQDQHLLQKISFHCLILDEAQAIKNPASQAAIATASLNAQFRLSVTGTPVENQLQDLWSQFNFLMPDLLGTYEDFSQELTSGSSDQRYLQRIRKKVTPFLLRRSKQEVAKDLPEKIEQIAWVEMDTAQRQFYENTLASIRKGVLEKVNLEGVSAHRMEIFESILRLRQICCHPLLIGSHGEGFSSCKLEALMNDLATLMQEQKKVLIYSQFTTMLQLMTKEVRTHNWRFAYLDGSTQNREKVVQQFQEDSKTQLFFVSLKAGGTGLNLTAADYVLLFDPWWNEAVENQAIDRAHRIGRQGTVIAKRYIVAESIEEKMMKLKAAKRALAQELFMESEQALSLTEEEVRYLMS